MRHGGVIGKDTTVESGSFINFPGNVRRTFWKMSGFANTLLRITAYDMNAIPAESILRMPQVRAITGLSKSSIYAKIAHGDAHYDFPKPVRLGARSVGWLASDIFAWVAARPKA